MSLLEKFIATAAAPSPRETVYGKVMAFSGLPPATVNGEPKERILVTIDLGNGHTKEAGVFRDSVYGLPTFVPVGGLDAQVTLRASKDSEGKEWINVVSLGIKAS